MSLIYVNTGFEEGRRKAAAHFLQSSLTPGTVIDDALFDEVTTEIQDEAFMFVTNSKSTEEVLRSHEGQTIEQFVREVRPL